MSEPIIPMLPSIMGKYNTTETSTLDGIGGFDMDITEAEFEEILADNNNFIKWKYYAQNMVQNAIYLF